MRQILIVALLLSFSWLRSWGEVLFEIPRDADKELPPGVPRTVDAEGRVVAVDDMFTTQAYRQEAFSLVLAEANRAAADLGVRETLPIRATNLTTAFIGPFGLNYQCGAIGNVTTSNYWYAIRRGNKFSDVTITDMDNRCREYVAHYQWSTKRLDTNAAYQLATQWLAAVHMDVAGLNRDYDMRVAVDPYWNAVEAGQVPKRKFTPIYGVYWLTKGKRAFSAGGGATVEMFLPTRTLLSLSVDDPKYILRPALVFTNLAALFPGKGKITTNSTAEPILIDMTK